MFVSSVIAVVLAGSGLIAVVLLGRGTEIDSGIDRCVLGSWRMISHTEQLTSLGQTIQLTLTGEGALYEFRQDGTGSADYGDGTAFESTTLGQTVRATIAGALSFRYEAADDTFQVVEMLDTDATFTVDMLGSEVPSPYQLSTTTPERYRCEGDTISFSLEERGYSAEYRRV